MLNYICENNFLEGTLALDADEVPQWIYNVGAYVFRQMLWELDKDPEMKAKRLAFKKQYRKEQRRQKAAEKKENEKKVQMERA